MLKNLMNLFSKSSSSSTTYSSSNQPKYIYKILPHSTVNQRYAFPIPTPASHEFALSELDAKDGFLHFSTEPQIKGTLERFFTNDPAVTLLKCDYGRLSGFKIVKWEKASNGQEFPHLYAQLEGENVEDFKELWRGRDGTESWSDVLDKARNEGWLQ